MGKFYFLKKKRGFFVRFSAFYGQRSVKAFWATRSPWSIGIFFFFSQPVFGHGLLGHPQSLEYSICLPELMLKYSHIEAYFHILLFFILFSFIHVLLLDHFVHCIRRIRRISCLAQKSKMVRYINISKKKNNETNFLQI